MFDAEALAEQGYDLDVMAGAIEKAQFGIRNLKSKEAEWLRVHLENMQDECEGHAL